MRPTELPSALSMSSRKADLNQASSFNSSYKANLLRLKHFVLIRFLDDEMVVPAESQWFGFYRRGQSIDLESLRQNQRLYRVGKAGVDEEDDSGDDDADDDPLGLRKMDAEGRLHFIQVPGGHLQLSLRQYDKLIDEYLV